jgi:hypothetical protein
MSNLAINKKDVVNLIATKVKDIYRDFKLTSGNCGVFAIALKEIINDGELYGFDRTYHIVLKLEDKYLDGTGIYTKEEIEKQWYYKVEKEDITEQEILDGTCRDLDVKDMKKIILMWVKDRMSEAMRYYRDKHE